jgi:sec-independent protein translocase protein TatA
MTSLLAYFAMPGPFEMLIIAVIVLLLFGNRLPTAMRSLGRGVVEFKKGIQGIEEEIDQASTKKEEKEAEDKVQS